MNRKFDRFEDLSGHEIKKEVSKILGTSFFLRSCLKLLSVSEQKRLWLLAKLILSFVAVATGRKIAEVQ